MRACVCVCVGINRFFALKAFRKTQSNYENNFKLYEYMLSHSVKELDRERGSFDSYRTLLEQSLI